MQGVVVAPTFGIEVIVLDANGAVVKEKQRIVVRGWAAGECSLFVKVVVQREQRAEATGRKIVVNEVVVQMGHVAVVVAVVDFAGIGLVVVQVMVKLVVALIEMMIGVLEVG